MASEESCYRFFLCTDGESRGRRSHQRGRAKQFVQEDSETTSTLVHLHYSGARTHLLALKPTGMQQPAFAPLRYLHIQTRWAPQSAYNWETLGMLGRVLVSPAQNPTRDFCRSLAAQTTMLPSPWYCGGWAARSLAVLAAVGHWEAKEHVYLLQWVSVSVGVSDLFLIKATSLTLPEER